MQSKQQKKIFSVSTKYEEVLDILQDVPNQSEFICQAILEKAHAKPNTQEPMPNRSYSDNELESKIKAIIANMITDDTIIIASKSQINTFDTPNPPVATPVIKKEEPSPVKDDDSENIKNIINAW